LRDCPAPLDQCLAQGRNGEECEQSVCQLPVEGESEAQSLPVLDKVNACDEGRAIDFVHADAPMLTDEAGDLTGVASNGSGGFLLFGPNLPALMSVSAQGDVVRMLPALPFEKTPSIEQIQPLDDGSLVLVGLVGESRLEHAWIGKLDANWQPVWERQLELESVEQADLALLPDGSLIVGAVRWLDRLVPKDSADDAFLARFTAEGEPVWERRFSFTGVHSFSITHGFSILARTENLLRLVVPSDEGVFLVASDFDGELDGASLEQPLPESVSSFSESHVPELVGIEALPGDRVVVYAAQHASLVDADGQLELEYALGDDEYLAAMRYDAIRGELVGAGEYVDPAHYVLPGPMIRAFALDGETTWQERRPAVTFDSGGKLNDSMDGAPPLTDAAIDAAGNILMTGEIGRGLEWVWVGAQTCGG
jgi:hypothetical protein